MQLEQELAGYTSTRDSLVAIGVFDGVHLGHKYFNITAKGARRANGYASIVITFDQHPQKNSSPIPIPSFYTILLPHFLLRNFLCWSLKVYKSLNHLVQNDNLIIRKYFR